jgi:hypothetical protein
LLDPTDHIGDAPQRALALAARIRALPPFPNPPSVIGDAASAGVTDDVSAGAAGSE